MQRFEDAVPITDAKRTQDGFLVVNARMARTGVQYYTGDSMGRADLELVAVYRPGEEVFADEAMASFSNRPITVGHPGDMVSAKNWRDVAVGHVGDVIEGESKFVRAPMMISDEKAIDAIEGGTRELSAGYRCKIDWQDGVTPDGESYQAIQRDIRINHVAIVPRGRAGSECRIGDADKWGAAPITTSRPKEDTMSDALKTVMVDGLSVQTTDAGAQAIKKLQDEAAKAKSEHDTAIADAKAGHEAAIKAKDAEIAKKDAEIDALKGKILSDADLDKRVADRASLVATAAKIAKDVKTEGLSDAEIRKSVVVSVLGDAAIAEKSEAYIDARFDILAEDAGKADPVRDAIKGAKPVTDDRDRAYQDKIVRLNSAWKGDQKKDAS